jgi:hypothetical protein
MSKTTQHTCGGPVFGKKTPGCPRCDELIAGAAPVVWNTRTPEPYVRHTCKGSGCSGDPDRNYGRRGICTFGDW